MILDKRLLYSAYRIVSVHAGPDGLTKIVHGTCFHINMHNRFFLVTNRHNVELSFKDPKYVGYRWQHMEVGGYSSKGDYIELSYLGHTVRCAVPKNSAEDVFVLEIPKAPFHLRRLKKPGEDPSKKTVAFDPIFVGIDMFATDKDLEKLSPGSQILLPSYSAHYDHSSERPVMRGGIISSDPMSDYQMDGQEPARRVLFQAHSAEGASGGPVFALMGNQGVLLGINAGHLTGNEPKIGTIHSGFSYCFKSACIREAIDAIISEAKDKLTRSSSLFRKDAFLSRAQLGNRSHSSAFSRYDNRLGRSIIAAGKQPFSATDVACKRPIQND